MKKRGQFFLVAALILITVTIGIGTVYNSVRVTQENVLPEFLAKEIKHEIVQKVNSLTTYEFSGGYGGLDYDSNNIQTEVTNVVRDFSAAYPSYKILIVTVDRDKNFLKYYFENGVLQNNPDWPVEMESPTYNQINNQIILRSTDGKIYYDWKVFPNIYNSYVYVEQRGQNDEKTIAAA